MKSFKKWLFDKEGLFIIITWWFIALVIFTIILGSSIKNVVDNSGINATTIDSYVHEFIDNGDNIIPYNENVKSTTIGTQMVDGNKEYYLSIREYNHRYNVKHTDTLEVSGAGTSQVNLEYDLEYIDNYYIVYNYTNKTISIELIETKAEAPLESLPIKLKTTDSKAIHVLWNDEDTTVSIDKGAKIKVGRSGEFVVINDVVTNVSFYKPVNPEDENAVDEKVVETITPTESTKKEIPFELVVEYKMTSKSYTTKKYDLTNSTLGETEKEIVNISADYFTKVIEGSIGIKASAFTLLIVSSIVEVLLIGGAIAGIIIIKRSKEE